MPILIYCLIIEVQVNGPNWKPKTLKLWLSGIWGAGQLEKIKYFRIYLIRIVSANASLNSFLNFSGKIKEETSAGRASSKSFPFPI